MTFLYPLGLIGLLSLPVILILHLLRERQRRYLISDLSLWSFLDTRVRGPRTRRIPITWLLFLDLLIAALISLAWSQPRIAVSLPFERAKHNVILIDVSSSMLAKEGSTNRFAQAKTQASALLEEMKQSDIVTILTFGRQARLVADSRFNDDFEQIAQIIKELQAGETGDGLREALALGASSVEKGLPVEFHVVTDGGLPPHIIEGLSTFPYPIYWQWIGQPVTNQAIVELNVTQIAQNKLQVFSRFMNFSDRLISRNATLEIDGQLIDRTLIEIPPDSSIPRIWQVTIGASKRPALATVALEGEDYLTEDDTAIVSLQTGGKTRVALVSGNPDVIQQAIRAIPNVELAIIAPENYSSFSLDNPRTFDLTIFRDFLPRSQYWPAGQVLIIEPPAKDVENGSTSAAGELSLYSDSYRDIPGNAFVKFPRPDPILDGIDFSGVLWAKAWTLADPPPELTPLLLAGDIPLLLRGEVDWFDNSAPRQILVLLADLNQGNFSKHPAFPILLANIVYAASQSPLPASVKTGEEVRLAPTTGLVPIRVMTPRGSVVDLSTDPPLDWIQTLAPGIYRFEFQDEAGEIIEFFTGANVGDEMESDLRRPARFDTVNSEPREVNSTISQEKEPFDLWPWLLSTAILVLLLEAYLAWRS